MARLAIDVHDVVAGYATRLLMDYGWPIRWDGQRFTQMWPNAPWKFLLDDINHGHFLSTLPEIPGAREALWAIFLDGRWDPFFLTSTRGGGPSERETRKWMDRRSFPAMPIYFVGERQGDMDAKVSWLAESDVEIVIDDSVTVCRGARKQGKRVIVFRAPWNENLVHDGFDVADGWDAVMSSLRIITPPVPTL
jgi:hypothetical protein